MAIIKQNTYIPGYDIPAIMLNHDFDRLGVDMTIIDWYLTGTPNQIIIRKGSIIEHEGNTYLINSDEIVNLITGHNYIVFDGISFNSSASIGTYDVEKQGYYFTTKRTLKWYIYQTDGVIFNLWDIMLPSVTPMTKRFDHIKIGLSTDLNTNGIIPFDTIYFDELNSFNIGSHRFIASESGYYLIILNITLSVSYGVGATYYIVRINGSDILYSENHISISGNISPVSSTIIIKMKSLDYIDCYYNLVGSLAALIKSGEDRTNLCITRII